MVKKRIKAYADFIKLEHTIFSLPLIIAGTLLHSRSWPGGELIILVIFAAVGGRVMAMGINRIIDAEIDARNPRTKGRGIPSGAMRTLEAWVVVAVAGLLYAASAAAIAPICLWLSPIPVALFVLYPYLKRITAFAHLGLGITWSMAPIGGWLAASQSFEFFVEIAWLWLFSVFWVAGFDVIYATLDEVFDRKEGLKSLPVKLGLDKALHVAVLWHVIAFMSLTMLLLTQLRTSLAFVCLGGVSILFIWQHMTAKRRPEFAFFQLNAALGFLVLGLVIAGIN